MGCTDVRRLSAVTKESHPACLSLCFIMLCPVRTVRSEQTRLPTALCVRIQGCTCDVCVKALAHGVSGRRCEGPRAQSGQRAPARAAQAATQIAGAGQPCAAGAPLPPAAAAAWQAADRLLSCPQQGLQTQLACFRTCCNGSVPTSTCCCCAFCCDLQRISIPLQTCTILCHCAVAAGGQLPLDWTVRTQ